MVEINTTPLVDVMLVLLIIFLVTAPLMTQSVKVNLPQASAQPVDAKPEVVRLAIDASGTLYWNDEHLTNSMETLEMRLRNSVTNNAKLEVQLSADKDTRYQQVAEVMAATKRAGVTKLGFITLPGTSR